MCTGLNSTYAASSIIYESLLNIFKIRWKILQCLEKYASGSVDNINIHIRKDANCNSYQFGNVFGCQEVAVV